MELKRVVDMLGAFSEASSLPNLPNPELSYLEISSSRGDNLFDLAERLEIFSPKAGWAVCQSQTHLFTSGKFNLSIAENLLYGEFVRPDTSLHVRQDGRGGWICTQYNESTSSDNAEQFIVTNSSYLADTEECDRLYYRVFWGNKGNQGLKALYYRLSGLE